MSLADLRALLESVAFGEDAEIRPADRLRAIDRAAKNGSRSNAATSTERPGSYTFAASTRTAK